MLEISSFLHVCSQCADSMCDLCCTGPNPITTYSIMYQGRSLGFSLPRVHQSGVIHWYFWHDNGRGSYNSLPRCIYRTCFDVAAVCLGYSYVSVYHMLHDDVIKWKHFPRHWPFARGLHRSPVNSPHKGQWRGALMFSFICTWINRWVNNREAVDLRHYCAHYDVSVMEFNES